MLKLINGDCLQVLKTMPDSSIDLVITDPPYLIKNTKAGGKSKLSKSIQYMNDEIRENNLVDGYNTDILNELVRVMKNINIYIWCNHIQIPMYIDYFVNNQGCSFDILIWNKVNATPLFNNKYLTDKEYCLYFRKNGYCNPNDYERAKTVYYQPINVLDKKKYGHPTIKPLNIIENLVLNSSKENDVILDCFMGSGTVGEASLKHNRGFVGIEIDKKYFETAKHRIEDAEIEMNIWKQYGLNIYQ